MHADRAVIVRVMIDQNWDPNVKPNASMISLVALECISSLISPNAFQFETDNVLQRAFPSNWLIQCSRTLTLPARKFSDRRKEITSRKLENRFFFSTAYRTPGASERAADA